MFESLLSNTRMKQELSRAIAAGKPMHAYLFCGADGSGKMTAAKLLATELVGGDRGKAERGTHPDIFVLEPETGKKLISVQQVRNMRNDAFINPSEGVRKIYIVDGMERVNEAGQNALLTILEQPPSFATFILLSESREKVLPTVISRCSVFEMEYVDADEGTELLKKQMPAQDPERLRSFMKAAQGNVGHALKLATNNEFEEQEKQCTAIAYAMASKDAYTLAKLLSPFTKDTLPAFLPVLAMYLKDVLVSRCAPGAELVFRQSILQNKTVFDKIDINTLYDGVSECEKAMKLLEGNVSSMLITATLAIRLGGTRID
ncbi:MAG: hypothetical protein IJ408_00040 [Clostridia bacterium]|nr:hypothetical protein [Clostridia bacterium]